MTARTRKFLKFANQFLYVLSIAMLISGSFLSAITSPASAETGNAGSIWTATGSCGSPQDVNHYAVGDVVYVVYSNLGAGDHNWTINYVNESGKAEVAHGTQSGDSGCFAAWTIQPEEAGYVFQVDMGGKHDNYSVDGVIFVPAPGISIAKSITSAGPYDSVGDAIAYRITVTNDGNVPLTNILVTDPGANSAPVCPATTLAVGAQMDCTALHSVSQADLNAGSFTNTATANSTEAGPVSSSATATMTRLPALGVVKTLIPVDHYSVGQTLSYTIVATNKGNVTLDAVTITDPNAILGTCTPSNPANLAPGGTITCEATHVLTRTEINSNLFSNTAIATSGALSVNSTVNTEFNSSMTLSKTVSSSGPYTLGGTITYSIVATNNGNVSLHNVKVVDNNADSITCIPPSSTPPTIVSYLLVGQSMTCTASHTITLADMNAGIVNNTATGSANEILDVHASASVSLTAGPAISFEKVVTSVGPFGVGDTILYDLKLTNIGNITINGLTITDADAGIVMGTCTPALAGLSLDPQASATCTASHVVTLADMDAGFYTNTATGDSAQTPELTDSKTVEFTQSPAMTITKVATPGSYSLASSVPYTITVTNTGNITLHNVVVSDPSAVIGTCAPGAGSSLAPLATMTCSATHVVTQPDMDLGLYTNTSSALSTETGPVSATATVYFTQSPNLSIVKSVTSVAPEGGYLLGNTLTYNIVLTNTGNITLHNVTIADLNAVLGSCTPSVPAASLAVGGEITCAASHVIVQADLDAGLFENTAVGNSTEAGPKQDSETVAFTKGPAISFEKKEVSQGPYFVGDTISYALELANIGNVTLNNVTIADPSAVIGTCTPAIPVASLLPLAKVTCAATHVVTAADIAAGLTFMNTAVGDSDETLPKNSSVTANLAIKGCMDPNATNYNPKATVSDGSCTYPPNPTPTPVPTLPIPATGGEVLIPVTGADLSNTLPGASLPRNLYFGGLSVFGVAMVLTGLRRKYHL